MRALSYHLSLHFFVVDEARPMLWSCPFKGKDPGMDISRDSVLLLLSLTHIVFEKLIQIHCAIRDTNYFYSSILFVNKIQDGVVVYI